MTCLSCVCHCSAMVATGGVATLSINPVCSPPNTSAMGRGIGGDAEGSEGPGGPWIVVRHPDLQCPGIGNGCDDRPRHGMRESDLGDTERNEAPFFQARKQPPRPYDHAHNPPRRRSETPWVGYIARGLDRVCTKGAGGHHGTMQLPHSNLAQHGLVVAHNATGVELERHSALGLGLHLLLAVAQYFHPPGPFGDSVAIFKVTAAAAPAKTGPYNRERQRRDQARPARFVTETGLEKWINRMGNQSVSSRSLSGLVQYAG